MTLKRWGPGQFVVSPCPYICATCTTILPSDPASLTTQELAYLLRIGDLCSRSGAGPALTVAVHRRQPELDDEALQPVLKTASQLADMGFADDAIAAALQSSKNSLEAALELLAQ